MSQSIVHSDRSNIFKKKKRISFSQNLILQEVLEDGSTRVFEEKINDKYSVEFSDDNKSSVSMEIEDSDCVFNKTVYDDQMEITNQLSPSPQSSQGSQFISFLNKSSCSQIIQSQDSPISSLEPQNSVPLITLDLQPQSPVSSQETGQAPIASPEPLELSLFASPVSSPQPQQTSLHVSSNQQTSVTSPNPQSQSLIASPNLPKSQSSIASFSLIQEESPISTPKTQKALFSPTRPQHSPHLEHQSPVATPKPHQTSTLLFQETFQLTPSLIESQTEPLASPTIAAEPELEECSLFASPKQSPVTSPHPPETSFHLSSNQQSPVVSPNPLQSQSPIVSPNLPQSQSPVASPELPKSQTPAASPELPQSPIASPELPQSQSPIASQNPPQSQLPIASQNPPQTQSPIGSLSLIHEESPTSQTLSSPTRLQHSPNLEHQLPVATPKHHQNSTLFQSTPSLIKSHHEPPTSPTIVPEPEPETQIVLSPELVKALSQSSQVHFSSSMLVEQCRRSNMESIAETGPLCLSFIDDSPKTSRECSPRRRSSCRTSNDASFFKSMNNWEEESSSNDFYDSILVYADEKSVLQLSTEEELTPQQSMANLASTTFIGTTLNDISIEESDQDSGDLTLGFVNNSISLHNKKVLDLSSIDKRFWSYIEELSDDYALLKFLGRGFMVHCNFVVFDEEKNEVSIQDINLQCQMDNIIEKEEFLTFSDYTINILQKPRDAKEIVIIKKIVSTYFDQFKSNLESTITLNNLFTRLCKMFNRIEGLSIELVELCRFHEWKITSVDICNFEIAFEIMGLRYSMWLILCLNLLEYPETYAKVKFGIHKADLKLYPYHLFNKTMKSVPSGNHSYLQRIVLAAKKFIRDFRANHGRKSIRHSVRHSIHPGRKTIGEQTFKKSTH